MRNTHRMAAGALALLIAASLSAIPATARADRNGDRIAGAALGVTAAVLLATQHNKTAGLIAAAGAAYELTRGSGCRRDCEIVVPRWRDRGHDRDWYRDRDRRLDRDWRRDDDRYRRDHDRSDRWNHGERDRR